MSHYKNVKTLTDLAFTYDMQSIVNLIEFSDEEELADDIAYVIISLFASYSLPERKKFVDVLLTEITTHDFKGITYDEDSRGDLSGDESPPI